MTYNRSAIMKEAGRLMRLGWTRSDAMKAAWASAKLDAKEAYGTLREAPRQQEPGLRAALRRYGIDPDRLAHRAQEAVKAIVAAIQLPQNPRLLPYKRTISSDMEGSIELTRGEDGVYRI